MNARIGLSWAQLIAVAAGVAALGPIASAVGVPDAIAVRGPQLAACAACFVAVAHLHAGDPPRRAWSLFAIGHALILLGVAIQLFVGDNPTGQATRWGFVAIANVLGPLGMFHFGRALRTSGLVPTLAPFARTLVALLGGAATLHAGVAIWAIASDLAPSPTIAQTIETIGRTASVLGDAGGFALALLVVARVWTMAGGPAARPYLVVGASSALFLGLDIAVQASGVASYADLGPLQRLLPAFAFALTATGAIAQVALVRAVNRAP